MKFKMYVIHDSAINAFTTPHFARTHGEAERNFKTGINDQNAGHLFRHPEQFTLMYAGEYDDETGLVTPLASPSAVMPGIQAKERVQTTIPGT